MAIKNQLKEIRTEKHLNQDELAAAVGSCRKSISCSLTMTMSIPASRPISSTRPDIISAATDMYIISRGKNSIHRRQRQEWTTRRKLSPVLRHKRIIKTRNTTSQSILFSGLSVLYYIFNLTKDTLTSIQNYPYRHQVQNDICRCRDQHRNRNRYYRTRLPYCPCL